MSEPMVVWVARDGDGTLWLYGAAPRFRKRWQSWEGNAICVVRKALLPDLRPGECRRMRLVDAPETGEAS